MEFKIGDKVQHKDLGVGEIIGFDIRYNKYAVEFEKEGYMTHYFSQTYMDAGLSNPIDRSAGLWCLDNEIELVEEVPKNLIPQIAKMLGVEIGEQFYLRENFENDTNMNIYKFVEDGLKLNTIYGWQYVEILDELLAGKHTIQKLPKKSILTEDERVILRNIPTKYKYIARDYRGALYVYENKPKKDVNEWNSHSFDYFSLFQHLFQFIKWLDEEPYNIKELLKE